MKQIVIAGAGFGGVRCALDLHKRVDPDVQIILVDRNPYHLIHGNLYEVAASPEELTSLSQLKQSVAIRVEEIIRGTRIKFHQGTITQIDSERREIQLDQGKLKFDYLVAALGADPNFYGIPGADKYSIPLKTLHDSFAIRNKLEFLFSAHRLDTTKKIIRIAVAGGGFAGVEIAGELAPTLNFLAWKHGYLREKLEVVVIEGTNQLMPGMEEKVARAVHNRLRSFGVDIRLNTMIASIDEHLIEFKNGERMEYDCLIWTAGVKARPLPFTVPLETDKGNRIPVTSLFEIGQYHNIFAIGDQCCFLDVSGRPLAGTAQQAIDQGKYVAYAISRLLKNQTPQPYQCKQFGYIVPVGGKWAVLRTKSLFLSGRLGNLAQQFAWFRYFWSILGWRRALQLSLMENRLYSRNN